MRFFKDSALKTLSAAIFATIALAVFAVRLSPALPAGARREIYLYGDSAACRAVSDAGGLYLKKYVKGEAAYIADEAELDKMLADLRAKKVFSERGSDFSNVYYYSPKIRGYLVLGGKKVNLHVSETRAGIKAGAPLIFGGY